ncbi:MAG TPA: glycoside hydrolase family 6 protein [Nocardioidaceae bacterium]|nr:glycoside hydrolase family 6 protein [Nocardioidaceae bacterium]
MTPFLPRRTLVPVLAALALSLSAAGSAAPVTGPAVDETATAARAAVTGTGNPLAGRPWGVYKGSADQSWDPYVNSSGTTRRTLAKIALRPKAKWFGAWIPNSQIASKVRDYVANSQDGNRNALVQMAVFRMVPWEHDACRRLPTAAQQASYKRWTDRFARGVGSAHAAIILQPDGPFALCAPHGSRIPSRLIAYSARVLSALPNTSVYIDAGAADWPAAGSQGGVGAAVKILTRAGVRYTRGFALNSTHYSSTANEVARGTAIVRALRRRGYGRKHFVVNTSSNGHPFVFGRYTGSDPDNAFVCRSRTEPAARTCVTLGIPPTADVTNSRWRQSATTNRRARRHVDGYLWFGRPWLYRQADPFVMQRALQLVRSTPYS